MTELWLLGIFLVAVAGSFVLTGVAARVGTRLGLLDYPRRRCAMRRRRTGSKDPAARLQDPGPGSLTGVCRRGRGQSAIRADAPSGPAGAREPSTLMARAACTAEA